MADTWYGSSTAAHDDTTPDSDESYFKECKDLLEGQGIHLPGHVTPETFLRDLCVALHATAYSQQGKRRALQDRAELRETAERSGQGGGQSPAAMALSMNRRVANLERDSAERRAEKRRLSHARPQRATAAITPERARAVAAEQLRNSGLRPGQSSAAEEQLRNSGLLPRK